LHTIFNILKFSVSGLCYVKNGKLRKWRYKSLNNKSTTYSSHTHKHPFWHIEFLVQKWAGSFLIVRFAFYPWVVYPVARSLVVYVCFLDRCLSLCTFLLAIVLFVLLRYTDSDCPWLQLRSNIALLSSFCVNTSALSIKSL
jgi:hypothetical protein